MGRSRGRGAGIVGRHEKPRDRTARTPPLSHFDHRSDEKTHHVMEKTVCRHFEHPAAVALDPPSMLNDAAVVIVSRRRVRDGKRTERVFAQHTIGLALQCRRIERVTDGPLVAPPERGTCRLIRPNKIIVSPRDGAPPGMEIRHHPMGLRDPDVVGENGVDGTPEGVGIPARGHPDANPLSVRVDAGVGSAGADRRNGGCAQPREGHFHVALHGADDGLTLPTGEAPPVILRYQEDRSRVHDVGEARHHTRSLQLTRVQRRATIARSRPLTFPPFAMPPRSLASLAYALSASSDLDGALIALGECLAELDRGASVALLHYDARRDMLRDRSGEGVAGRVAAAREPLLVQDVRQASQHPLLRDQYFTTGSFISFPLVYHDELVGVLNLTNRAQRGVFTDEDVERVRVLGLVMSLILSLNALPTRLLEPINVR